MNTHRGLCPLLTLPKVRVSEKKNFCPLSPPKSFGEEGIGKKGKWFCPRVDCVRQGYLQISVKFKKFEIGFFPHSSTLFTLFFPIVNVTG